MASHAVMHFSMSEFIDTSAVFKHISVFKNRQFMFKLVFRGGGGGEGFN